MTDIHETQAVIKSYISDNDKKVICHWCGISNHEKNMKITIHKISDLSGCSNCWNMFKFILIELGVATADTKMIDIPDIYKKTKKALKESGINEM